MRRQLDTSAIRVTELEQDSKRHEFRAERLEESYREALSRLGNLTAEYEDKRKAWESERRDITLEMKQQLKGKDIEIRQLVDEKDRVEAELKKVRVSQYVQSQFRYQLQ
jgi:chromosome segregation ATPase